MERWTEARPWASGCIGLGDGEAVWTPGREPGRDRPALSLRPPAAAPALACLLLGPVCPFLIIPGSARTAEMHCILVFLSLLPHWVFLRVSQLWAELGGRRGLGQVRGVRVGRGTRRWTRPAGRAEAHQALLVWRSGLDGGVGAVRLELVAGTQQVLSKNQCPAGKAVRKGSPGRGGG